MKITIEIGDQNLVESIKQEIEILVSNHYADRNWKPHFIIPEDFTKKVSELTRDNNYNSVREISNQTALGITLRDVDSILIDPICFTELFDAQIRNLLYHHEMAHFYYEPDNPGQKTINKKGEYLAFLDKFYDEYVACKTGLSVTKSFFNQPSDRLKNYVKLMSVGHYENLKNNSIYHTPIDQSIESFKRRNISIEGFLKILIPKFHAYTADLITCLSYKEVYPELFAIEMKEDQLLNEYSFDLIDFFNSTQKPFQTDYVTIKTLDNYFKNFGLSLTDMDGGVYYGVDYLKK